MLLAMVWARSLAIEGDGTVLGVHVDLDGTQIRVFGQPGRHLGGDGRVVHLVHRGVGGLLGRFAQVLRHSFGTLCALIHAGISLFHGSLGFRPGVCRRLFSFFDCRVQPLPHGGFFVATASGQAQGQCTHGQNGGDTPTLAAMGASGDDFLCVQTCGVHDKLLMMTKMERL